MTAARDDLLLSLTRLTNTTGEAGVRDGLRHVQQIVATAPDVDSVVDHLTGFALELRRLADRESDTGAARYLRGRADGLVEELRAGTRHLRGVYATSLSADNRMVMAATDTS